MHISESTILTKCSKMTEETKQHKRLLHHGVNGNADGLIKDEFHKANNYVQGGRLKFFKDGKFILELERSREGERMSWVSVPRKTFWPPQGTASTTPTYKQESSTSLSVSDDNSSIQSSPWQRDHSWKQTTPRRNVSRELAFYFWRPKSARHGLHGNANGTTNRRRRPHCSASEDANNGSVSCNRKKRAGRSSILQIVQNLVEKSSTATAPQTVTATSRSGVEVAVVSPRKRFLREMEKDGKSQSDENCQKRSRNKSATHAEPLCIKSENGVVVAANDTGIVIETALKSSPPSSMRNCSYSITSLLSDDRKRSPTNSPSQLANCIINTTNTVNTLTTSNTTNTTTTNNAAVITFTTNSVSTTATALVTATGATVTSTSTNTTHQHAHHQSLHHHHLHHHPGAARFCAAAVADDRWYSESVDRLRSIELTQADKRGYPGFSHPSYLPHYMYPCAIPPYYGPGVYGRGFMVPPVYPAPPLPLALRHDTPSCSWAIDPLIKEEENITDMPLNLSKHAG